MSGEPPRQSRGMQARLGTFPIAIEKESRPIRLTSMSARESVCAVRSWACPRNAWVRHLGDFSQFKI